jgi:voltage-gated potassium channel Kch
LLAGLAFAYSFEILLALDHSAIHIPDTYSLPSIRTGLMRYFSFVTLTTLGYGDILPVSPIARSLATSEALFGQLYPAVMIARLISVEILDRRRHDSAD